MKDPDWGTSLGNRLQHALQRFRVPLGQVHHDYCMNAYSEHLRRNIIEAKERTVPLAGSLAPPTQTSIMSSVALL